MSPSSEEHSHSHVLRARFERHRSLVSAWERLAALGLSVEKCDVGDAGDGLGEDLLELASGDPPGADSPAVAEIDARLDELEAVMRASALQIPVHQLRSRLPRGVQPDRQGLLDLLDLLLGAEVESLEGVEVRIPALDHLITLLCIGESGRDAAVLYDPVTLTPRLAAVCERSDLDVGPGLSEVEAEFYAAADLYEADAGQQVAKRSLRRRKAALGSAYFSPRILRAIVTYNSARLRGVDEEAAELRDRGTTALTLEPAEGSGAALEDEHGWIGQGSHEAATECVGAVEQDATPVVAGARAKEALRPREPMAPPAFGAASKDAGHGRATARAGEPASHGDDFGRVAQELAREALEGGPRNGGRAAGNPRQRAPAGRVVWGGGLICALLLAALALPGMFSNSDLAGYSRAELDALSPQLSSGARNLEGSGPAFVGAMYDDFYTRSAADQTRIAADLVAALRAVGVSQIMIYDSESRLRVQALGGQTVRVLSSHGG